MNKTISINLGGSVFNIEEDAYALLKGYLDNIKSLFAGDPAGPEIMSDIEARIAELFHERNNARKNVVVSADVEEVMTIMGRPQDYRLDEEAAPPQPEVAPTGMYHNSRKLYRDMDGALLSGVCSGLSHFLGVNLTVIRLLVILLCFFSFGAAILGYVLVWALVPPALTTSEKLHMRGESVNIESIGRIVNEESKAAAGRLNTIGRNVGRNLRAHSGRGGRLLLRILARIFGGLIASLGFAMLIGLVIAAAFSEVNVAGFSGDNWDILNRLVFNGDGTMQLLAVGIVLVVVAPAVALIYAGLKLLIRSNRRIYGLGISLLSLFIIGVLLCTYGGVKTGKQFSRDATLTNSIGLSEVKGDTLVLDVMPDNIFIGRHSRHQDEFFDLIKLSGDSIYYGQGLNVRFEPTASGEFKMEIERSSQGRNMEQAGNLARNIRFGYALRQDTLSVAPYLTTPADDPYRAQEVEIIVHVPIGKYVAFGKNSELVTWYAEEGEVQRMTGDGLEGNSDREWSDVDIESEYVIIEGHDSMKKAQDSANFRADSTRRK
jgi:phage shock protein PspC (stress-responsive transcriptional regulator)